MPVAPVKPRNFLSFPWVSKKCSYLCATNRTKCCISPICFRTFASYRDADGASQVWNCHGFSKTDIIPALIAASSECGYFFIQDLTTCRKQANRQRKPIGMGFSGDEDTQAHPTEIHPKKNKAPRGLHAKVQSRDGPKGCWRDAWEGKTLTPDSRATLD